MVFRSFAVRLDALQIFGMGGFARLLVEAGIGQGDRTAGKHGIQRLGGRTVMQGRLNAAAHHFPKTDGPIQFGQRITGAQLEEQGAHLGLDPRVDDREDLGPTAMVPGAPDGGHRPSAGTNDAVHLFHGPPRIGYIHQSERVVGDVEIVVDAIQLLRFHAVKGHVRQTRRRGQFIGPLHHLVGDIDTDHPAVRSYKTGRPEGHQAGTAGNVEHAESGLQMSHFEEEVLRGKKRLPPASFVVFGGAVPSVPLHAQLQSCFHGQLGFYGFRRTSRTTR